MELHAHHHTHTHPHTHPATPRNHVAADDTLTTRRDFFRILAGGALAGASVLELAYHRAAWASAAAPTAASNLFNLQKVAPGVFFAMAHPQAQVNCNAAIFVRSKDVVVVDAHSKPSAAASLIAQIKREVTTLPVRYVINTHFHWDHVQGNHAYRVAEGQVDFIATAATKKLMQDLSLQRLKESLDKVPAQIDDLRQRAAHSTSASEKAFCAGQIRQLQAYAAELKDFKLELPTITFDDSYHLADPAFDLHLGFHGRAHTAGDVFVLCPQARTLATGDASHGWLPFMHDCYPHQWPHTIDAVGKLDFKFNIGGHGPLQSDRTVMICQRNYIEELTARVEEAQKAGQPLAEMQKRITVASLKSMHSNAYEDFLNRTLTATNPHYGPMPPLQEGINENIADVLKNLDWA
jgi:glyoxylase-like metal-dependent hydrolase (beta-lactamase superfamily II)